MAASFQPVSASSVTRKTKSLALFALLEEQLRRAKKKKKKISARLAAQLPSPDWSRLRSISVARFYRERSRDTSRQANKRTAASDGLALKWRRSSIAFAAVD